MQRVNKYEKESIKYYYYLPFNNILLTQTFNNRTNIIDGMLDNLYFKNLSPLCNI